MLRLTPNRKLQAALVAAFWFGVALIMWPLYVATHRNERNRPMDEFKRLEMPTPAPGVRLEWKLADMWVGVFWKVNRPMATRQRIDVWVCLLPTLPIHIWWYRRVHQSVQE